MSPRSLIADHLAGIVMADQRVHFSCVAGEQKHLVICPRASHVISVHWDAQSENNPVVFY